MSFAQNYQQWISSINLNSQLIVVLGIGNGEHFLQLRQQFKGKIAAVDFGIKSVENLNLSQSKVEVTLLKDVSEIYEREVFKDVVMNFSAVHQFAPACVGKEEQILRLKQILTGKDFYSFLRQSEILKLNNQQIDIKEKVHGQNVATPVRELGQWPLFSNHESALIWSAIKEVIK